MRRAVRSCKMKAGKTRMWCGHVMAVMLRHGTYLFILWTWYCNNLYAYGTLLDLVLVLWTWYCNNLYAPGTLLSMYYFEPATLLYIHVCAFLWLDVIFYEFLWVCVCVKENPAKILLRTGGFLWLHAEYWWFTARNHEDPGTDKLFTSFWIKFTDSNT